MLKYTTIYFISMLSTFLAFSQNCPDDINNSPGTSTNSVNAVVYDSNGNVIQIINCDATGNSGQVDCDLSDYNFPPGSIISIDLDNGTNSSTCYYNADGTLINQNIELPVDFGGLKVENNGGINKLFWTTYSERNNSFFKLEYSSNGTDWEEFENVSGAGNSNTQIVYSTTHKDFKSGTNYYRISQQDIDGKNTMLETTSIENKFGFDIVLKNNQIEIFSDKKIKSVSCFGLDGRVLSEELISDNYYKVNSDFQGHSAGFFILHVVFFDGSSEQKKIFLT